MPDTHLTDGEKPLGILDELLRKRQSVELLRSIADSHHVHQFSLSYGVGLDLGLRYFCSPENWFINIPLTSLGIWVSLVADLNLIVGLSRNGIDHNEFQGLELIEHRVGHHQDLLSALNEKLDPLSDLLVNCGYTQNALFWL